MLVILFRIAAKQGLNCGEVVLEYFPVGYVAQSIPIITAIKNGFKCPQNTFTFVACLIIEESGRASASFFERSCFFNDCFMQQKSPIWFGNGAFRMGFMFCPFVICGLLLFHDTDIPIMVGVDDLSFTFVDLATIPVWISASAVYMPHVILVLESHFPDHHF